MWSVRSFFIIDSPIATMFFFSTFGWWVSGWNSLKLTSSYFNLSSFSTFDSLFLSFRKLLFLVVWLILLLFVILMTQCFWTKTFWACIRLLLCSRMELISFYLFFMSSFGSLFSVSKSLILVYKLPTVPWSILDEVFRIFADVNDSFLMVWSSSMKNDYIAIILPLSLASSASNFELNNELITEFEWNGWGV